MIAVSSFRPLGQNPDWDRNQLAAKASWERVFEEIIYFNQEEPRLDSPKTAFLPTEGHPFIRQLCALCALSSGWSCIINADIVVSPELATVERRASARHAMAMTSYRYTTANGRTAVIDNGLDWFAARGPIWAEAARQCPPQLRIGHPTWDTWMIGFLNHACGRSFINVTSARLIFHPKHEDRRHVCNVDGGLDGMQWYCGMPAGRL